MRLLLEIVIVAALIWFGWEIPYQQRMPGYQPPKPVVVVQPVTRNIPRPAATPSGEWMRDPSHRTPLDRPAYDPREPKPSP